MTKEILAVSANRSLERWSEGTDLELYLDVIRGEKNEILTCKALTYASACAVIASGPFNATARGVSQFGVVAARHVRQRRVCAADVSIKATEGT